MKRMRTLGPFLVAVFATSAVSASAALPEFTPPFPKPFTSKTKMTLIVGKTKVKCAAGTNKGQITGPQTGTVTIALTGCEALGFSCVSPGAGGSGEILTSVLSGTLGYINRATKEVGFDLSSPPTGAPFTTFTCGNLTATVQGSVIGKMTAVNKKIKPPMHFSLRFLESKGKQQITHLDGGPIDVLATSLGGGPFQESALVAPDAITFAEVVEIKA